MARPEKQEAAEGREVTATVPACDACGAESCPNPTIPSAPTCMGHYLCHAHWMQPWGETREAITRRKSLAKDAPAERCDCREAKATARAMANEHGVGYTVICQVCRKRCTEDPTIACYECGILVTRDGNAADQGEMVICRPCKTKQAQPPKPERDPYAEHRDRVAGLVEFEMTTDEAARNAAMQTKLDQAKQSLDRPGHAKRYREIASPWDSDDVDDGYCTF